MFFLFLFCRFLATDSHHLTIFNHLPWEKRRARSISWGFKRTEPLWEPWEHRKDVTQYRLEGFWHKRGRRLQIKHSNQLRWEVVPWERGLGFWGMALKFGFWRLCLLVIAELRVEPKPTWTKAFPDIYVTTPSHGLFKYLHPLKLKMWSADSLILPTQQKSY